MALKVVRSASPARDPERTVFRLTEGVRVRKEKFGLLFYNYRGPRIYFVPSKELIPDDFFDGQKTTSALVDSIQKAHGLPRRKVRDHVKRILDTLEAKGLINGQPLC